MMKCKSKKSRQHDNIKTGVVGIIAMAVIVITVLLINSATLNAFVPIKYTQTYNYKERTIMPSLDPYTTRRECEYQGLKQCEAMYPPWEYTMSTPRISYKVCERNVKDICGRAPVYYYNDCST